MNEKTFEVTLLSHSVALPNTWKSLLHHTESLSGLTSSQATPKPGSEQPPTCVPPHTPCGVSQSQPGGLERLSFIFSFFNFTVLISPCLQYVITTVTVGSWTCAFTPQNPSPPGSSALQTLSPLPTCKSSTLSFLPPILFFFLFLPLPLSSLLHFLAHPPSEKDLLVPSSILSFLFLCLLETTLYLSSQSASTYLCVCQVYGSLCGAILHSVEIPHFKIHLSVDGYIGRFQSLAIRDCSALHVAPVGMPGSL